MKKGILLAGGEGTRLYPLSLGVSKQLQRVYDKPMIYYPLSTLIYSGIREICVVAPPRDIATYEGLFGSGEALGLNIQYREQAKPLGIAHGLISAASFIGGDPVAVILGDNFFHGSFDFQGIFSSFTSGAHLFAHRVKNPERYGVIELDERERPLSIQEKPSSPRSAYAVTGLYLFDSEVLEICGNLSPSQRGELEITDVNREYLKKGRLTVSTLGRGMTWLDMGTVESLHAASDYVRIVEARQGVKIGCPEELALRRGLISADQFLELCRAAPECAYKEYLVGIAAEYGSGA